jgi:hypothetical protein
MRRISVAAGTVVAALGTTAALAGAASDRDRVQGHGISAIGTKFNFSGHSSVNGNKDATGSAKLRNEAAGTERDGKIICVNAQGNRAVFAIEMKHQPGDYRTFIIEDNGKPKKNTPSADRLTQLAAGPDEPTCDTVPAAPAGLVIASGDITVDDAG